MNHSLARLLGATLLLSLMIAAGCSNPLEPEDPPVLIETTDTLYLTDTLFIDDSDTLFDTVYLTDTVHVNDTVFVRDCPHDCDDHEDHDDGYHSNHDCHEIENCYEDHDNCDDCSDGKPRILTMRYTGEGCDASQHNQGSKVVCSGTPGAGPVMIRVTDKRDPNDNRAGVYFDGGPIAVGGTFNIDAANAGSSRLRSTTFVHIYQNGVIVQSVEFHTSCSRPLAVGDQFGSLVLEVFITD